MLPATPPDRVETGGPRRVIAIVLATVVLLLAALMFVRTGDAMILVFGLVASLMVFVVVRGLPVAVSATTQVKLRCRSCGRLNAEDARYCDACGQPL